MGDPAETQLRRIAPVFLAAGLALLLMLTPSAQALACAGAWSVSADNARKDASRQAMQQLRIASEDVLIVWDAARSVQHLVRRATFDNADDDFGFLVPTPTVPVIAEAADAVFDRLIKLLERPVVSRWRLQLKRGVKSPFSHYFSPASATLRSGGAGDVQYESEARVLYRTKAPVAGYDAVVLEASDPAALGRWLKRHGYAYRPALAGWLKPYIAKGWKITAFKLSRSEAGRRAQSQAVRLSFSATAPMFPYREPADQRGPDAYDPKRQLRLFLVSDQRLSGVLADEAPLEIETAYASEPDDLAGLLAGALPEDGMPRASWVTCLIDRSAPRRGDGDLLFVPASSQQPLLPPPIYVDLVLEIPPELGLLLLFAVVLLGVSLPGAAGSGVLGGGSCAAVALLLTSVLQRLVDGHWTVGPLLLAHGAAAGLGALVGARFLPRGPLLSGEDRLRALLDGVGLYAIALLLYGLFLVTTGLAWTSLPASPSSVRPTGPGLSEVAWGFRGVWLAAIAPAGFGWSLLRRPGRLTRRQVWLLDGAACGLLSGLMMTALLLTAADGVASAIGTGVLTMILVFPAGLLYSGLDRQDRRVSDDLRDGPVRVVCLVCAAVLCLVGVSALALPRQLGTGGSVTYEKPEPRKFLSSD